jgi:hypothetical protein
VFELRITEGSDDAEEEPTGGRVGLGSSDLELVTDGPNVQTIGLRFAGVAIPAGAAIQDAWIQFQTDEESSDPTQLVIRGEPVGNAAPFQTLDGSISSRADTVAFVNWSPPPWLTRGEAGPDQRADGLGGIVQEVVSGAGWASGNAMVFTIQGSGARWAEAVDGDATGAALLHVSYRTDTPPTTTSSTTTTTTAPPTTTTTTLPNGHGVFELRIADEDDDGEEEPTGGRVGLGSSDLELVTDGPNVQTVGLRFVGVTIPVGATIHDAWIQFQVDEETSDPTDLTIRGEAVGDAAPFLSIDGNISNRSDTSAFVSWSPPPWPNRGDAGDAQKTPPLSEIVQEIVSGADWASGNAMVFTIEGSGERVAEAVDGDPTGAALLYVEYSTGGP